MPRITPNLWFDTKGKEAAEFYVSVFPNSEIKSVSYYGEAGPRPAGTVLVVEFVLDGQECTALNGGPEFTFDEAPVLAGDPRRVRGAARRPGRGTRPTSHEGHARYEEDRSSRAVRSRRPDPAGQLMPSGQVSWNNSHGVSTRPLYCASRHHRASGPTRAQRQ